jgi:hypothetical protein
MSKKGKRQETKGVQKTAPALLEKPTEHPLPVMVATAADASTSYRRNAASTIERSDRYKNIEDGMIPFSQSSSTSTYGGNCGISPRDAVVLCQKAYYNFSTFRNTIDLMTEFSTSKIFLKGGSKKSRDFFAALLNKLGAHSLQDRFFREYYRSGNVIIYQMDGEVQQEDLDKITQAFGMEVSNAKTMTLPVRFVILNPADIQIGNTLSFSNLQFYKVLSDYELERLRSPRTDEDRELFDNLPDDVKAAIKRRGVTQVLLPLDMSRTVGVFYKKQDYEPFAVPMGFPVLEDINWKAELKKMDMAITRTIQQAILLITCGESQKDGGSGVNPKHLEAYQKFFENQSVARVLIADYTTKAEFVIPDIGNLLDPNKYAQVDKDIREGLNNILINDNDKFANASVKIDIFVQRLKQAREAFLNEFLCPLIKNIARNIGLKNYPTPYFEEIDLKDSLEYAKIYTRLMELGILTPEEGFDAFENGKFPSADDSLQHQEEYRAQKDKGYYEPLVGGPFTQQQIQKQTFKQQSNLQEMAQQHEGKMKTKELKHQAENPPLPAPQIHINGQPGRPGGSKAPQTKKKATRVGGSFSVSKIQENLLLSQKLHNDVEKTLLKKFKLKELDAKQKEVAENVAEIILANEPPAHWHSKIAEYLESPIDKNPERINEIQDIALEHQLDTFLSSILYWSKNGE